MIFSVLAFIAVIVSICIKDRKKSLVVQSLNCICEAIYDFIISAFTGAVLSIINFIRTCLFINKDKFSKKIYLLILIIFESLIAINCIFTFGLSCSKIWLQALRGNGTGAFGLRIFVPGRFAKPAANLPGGAGISAVFIAWQRTHRGGSQSYY